MRKPLKLLYVINNLATGGAEKMLAQFLQAFAKRFRDIQVYALFITDESVTDFVDIFSKLGIQVIRLKSSLYTPRNVIKISKVIYAIKPDVVHVHLFPAQYWMAAVKCLSLLRFRMVFTEHSNENRRLNNRFFWLPDKLVYLQYDSVIAISASIKGRLENWIGTKNRIVVIGNGVDVEKFEAAEVSDIVLEEQSKGYKIMLMVARFEYPKRQDLVIKALCQLPQDVHLYLAGSGSRMLAAQRLVLELGLDERVRFLGTISNVPSLMKTVDLNLLCTEYEGMSGATLESMASRKPFIGSDVTGIKEFVGCETGLFENEPGAIALKIKEILYNVESANKNVRENFAGVQMHSLESMVDAHYDLYRKFKLKIQ